MVAFLRELGYEFCPVLLKSDGEPAIKAIMDEIAMERGEVQTIKEQSPKTHQAALTAWWSEPSRASKVCCAS